MNDWAAGAQIKVVHEDDGTVWLGVPWMDVPLVLKPGDQIMLSLGVALTAEGYIDGVGWGTHDA